MTKEKELLNLISEMIDDDCSCNTCKLKNIIDIIHEYEDNSVECAYPISRIQDISNTPVDELEAMEVFYLLDMLTEILIHCDLLPEDSRTIDKGDINVKSYTRPELMELIIVITSKITEILDFYGVLE